MDPPQPDTSAEPVPDAAASGPVDAKEQDLAGSLTELAGLSRTRLSRIRLSRTRLSLQDLLTEVASCAAQAIAGADRGRVDVARAAVKVHQPRAATWVVSGCCFECNNGVERWGPGAGE